MRIKEHKEGYIISLVCIMYSSEIWLDSVVSYTIVN